MAKVAKVTEALRAALATKGGQTKVLEALMRMFAETEGTDSMNYVLTRELHRLSLRVDYAERNQVAGTASGEPTL